MVDEEPEGGDPACWAHLFDDMFQADEQRAVSGPTQSTPDAANTDDGARSLESSRESRGDSRRSGASRKRGD